MGLLFRVFLTVLALALVTSFPANDIGRGPKTLQITCQQVTSQGRCGLDVSGIRSLRVDGDAELEVRVNNGNRLQTFLFKGQLRRPDYWYGEAGFATINLLQSEQATDAQGNPVLYGSLNNVEEGIIYSFDPDSQGNPTTIVRPTSSYPPEGHPLDGGGDHSRHLLVAPQLKELNTGLAKNLKSRKLTQLVEVLDVLVVWTNYAECKNSGLARGCTKTATTKANMEGRIALSISETNTAYSLSGIDGVSLRLVHAYNDPNYVEASTNAFDTALSNLRGTTDGKLDNVHSLRATYGADIVVMIIDDSQYCGLGYMGPGKDLMFSITAWNCATGYYSFGHEIAHNMGCQHDRGTANACTSSTINYGWRDPAAGFRSIMAYNCVSGQCDSNAGASCNRVQRFSNPDNLYNSKPMGNAQNNNAAIIRGNAAVIASYFTPQTPQPTNMPTTKTPTTATPTTQPTSPTASPPPTVNPVCLLPVCTTCSAYKNGATQSSSSYCQTSKGWCYPNSGFCSSGYTSCKNPTFTCTSPPTSPTPPTTVSPTNFPTTTPPTDFPTTAPPTTCSASGQSCATQKCCAGLTCPGGKPQFRICF